MNTIAQQITYAQYIAHQLGFTYLQYENLRHNYFIKWCKHYIKEHHISLKALTLNDHLINWYEEQWLVIVEKTFERHYGNDITIFSPLEVLHLLDDYAANLLPYYPKALLRELRVKN